MATNPEDQHEKEGVCMADVVKCAGACLERHAADRLVSGDLPSDENGQHLRRFSADWRDGIVWHRT